MAGNFVVRQGQGRESENRGPESGRDRRAVQPGSASSMEGQTSRPDPEVVEKAKRRRFSAEYKLSIVRQAEACGPGELGALLRKEGLYFSNLSCWRRQIAEGQLAALSSRKRGRKGRPEDPVFKRITELERENERLRKRLQQAEDIIELQKKISDVLGITMRNLDGEEKN